ncbi:hypothetical protein HBI56_083280 [Parastagonospora nodorum]|uniref:RING-type domain-containing protein n=2 Tax=Phaeosphaeria nodorum (strain SN15 / ATCC MYA-4574 / FGSC 10173) TaxID=321614 RepID=A0A7U2I892_PHANO|nr:hypothetical protein SNOG_10534 [Parastagonospora nodorum SN15]KAH3913456.1 hypothetical protein HBH56_103290 [Parastagonospora nodorum]EAT81928.1 hypothetical protein SNOG_10534 [Parastagonospora nodorum SN15]KAH3929438.1 hypothetical protein HBH54_127120 [Parastagonospora nodorum]KAH3951563.1 hypothetical protein HBH53_061140 [Parastagonospora nodorum]KAH3975533.1 hypothetical protein HBH52_125710 [Parastagonospora nodorum]
MSSAHPPIVIRPDSIGDQDDETQVNDTQTTLLSAHPALPLAHSSPSAQALSLVQPPPPSMATLRSQPEFLMTGIIPVPSNSDTDCAICTEALTTDVVKFIKCGHVFHCACILRWLQGYGMGNRRCPMCRAVLFGTLHFDAAQHSLHTDSEDSSSPEDSRPSGNSRSDSLLSRLLWDEDDVDAAGAAWAAARDRGIQRLADHGQAMARLEAELEVAIARHDATELATRRSLNNTDHLDRLSTIHDRIQVAQDRAMAGLTAISTATAAHRDDAEVAQVVPLETVAQTSVSLVAELAAAAASLDNTSAATRQAIDHMDRVNRAALEVSRTEHRLRLEAPTDSVTDAQGGEQANLLVAEPSEQTETD